MNLKVSIFAFILIFIIGCGKSTTEKTKSTSKLVYLEQGWTKENEFRELFYYTSQGSRLIPYKWFLALEQSDNKGMFRDPKFIASLGFLNHRPQEEEALNVYQELNPDGLPVGFVKDPPGAEDGWMGFTCAACHTGQINYKGHEIRVDGGPSMADLQTFLRKMRDSIKATLNEEAKFDRFAKKVKSPEKSVLRQELEKFNITFSDLVQRNELKLTKPDKKRDYGFARLDAFGAIVNKVAATLTPDNPENLGVSDAPVSYPFIWDAPKLEWVQWNGSANNPIGRNAGEVVGVYGQINKDFNAKPPINSSARLNELFLLEEWLKDLNSPKWPEEYLGNFDTVKVKRGEEIYENGGKKDQAKKKGCIGCHSLPSEKPDSGNGWTAKGKYFGEKQFIKINMIPLKKIGTDPRMAKNFAKAALTLGPLAPALSPTWAPDDNKPAAIVLKHFVELLIRPELDDVAKKDIALYLEYTGYRDPPENSGLKPEEPPNIMAYKARPLNGIWATAPYLHNGSVPNLFQLLSPPNERSKTFCVGSREFDPKNVGFVSDDSKGCGDYFTFDTNQPGNNNQGHDFAKDLEDDEREALLEFLKTL